MRRESVTVAGLAIIRLNLTSTESSVPPTSDELHAPDLPASARAVDDDGLPIATPSPPTLPRYFGRDGAFRM